MLEQPTPTHSPENPDNELKRLRERVAEQTALIAHLCERIRELWLSLARRASGSWMRSCICSMVAVCPSMIAACSATRPCSRLSSSSGLSGEWV